MGNDINREYIVNSLGEYIETIREIAKYREDKNNVLWYRGHSNINHLLLPSLYRDKRKIFALSDEEYTSVHLSEDMRMQHYHAKNYHFINKNMTSLEWMGLAQHHGIKTRLLDWSTSAIHSLIFAIEKSLKRKDFSNNTPCVWVLEPQAMNKRVVESIIDNKDIEAFIETFSDVSSNSDKELIRAFFEKLKENGNLNEIYIKSSDVHDTKLNYLYNLVYFKNLLDCAKSNPFIVFKRTPVNPIYLLLAKKYIEGCRKFKMTSSPLAVIHPLQCERIKAQQGVFTIFPFPSEEDETFDSMRMEYSESCKGILQKIVIAEPHLIAKEIRTIGASDSWLYPESPIINSEIENELL